MKKIFLLLTFIVLTSLGFAQLMPKGMNYQAIARNAEGKIIPNTDITLRISLISSEKNSIVSHYSEIHRVTTSENGMFSLVVGDGSVLGGNFYQVPWSTNEIWMSIEIKTDADADFIPIINNKLLAVPYAYHSGTANELVNSTGTYYGPYLNQNSVNGAGPVPSANWSCKGNVGTNPPLEYVGNGDYKDLVFKTNALTRLVITKDGDINIANSLNVGLDVNIGRDLNVARNVNLNTGLAGSTINNGPFSVTNGSPTVLTGTLRGDGNVTFKQHVTLDNAGLGSTSPATGALVVAGGVGIGENLNVGGKLNVTGATTLQNTLNVAGATKISNTLAVTGITTLSDKLNANGQVTIIANVAGGDNSYGAYPLRIEGSDQGVAIKLNPGTPNNDNNFVTFFNGSGGAVGRIEGETLAEATSSPEFIFDESILVAEETEKGVALGLAAIPVVVGGLIASTGPCGACLAMAAADLALATANLIAFNIFATQNLGVSYESGSADYAEWLERSNESEHISAGDIVGVNSGKISKYTKNAQQYLVISTKPAILGNMPMDGKTDLYEKVAFMGQIPVKVRGIVFSGDYILPSGKNDGTGIAVSPNEILANQYREIVGVAWSNAIVDNGVTLINLAIGLNANDVANLAVKQEAKIINLENNYNSLEQRLLALENGTSNLPGKPLKVDASQKTSAAPVKDLSKYELFVKYMPAELSAETMEEAMLYLRNSYKNNKIDIKDHPGLNRLFTDAAFKAEVIKKTQEKYKVSYQSILESVKNKN
jgi:hypothetical protein